ncbi:MAG TPA: creatininase family protein [Thermomicrobiales bacterium]|nr:creatininase family protein [Thermomicrobiales bacterium]
MSAISQTTVLANLTWPQAEEALKHSPIGLLPVGAIEAHGPHLPLDTDIIIAEATAHAAASLLQRGGIPCVVLPTVSYSVSFVGTSFPGTSPVDALAFGGYLTSLLTHAARQGYRAIICCNAHLEPAHVDEVQASCHRAEAATGVPVRSPDQRRSPFSDLLSDEFRAGARHAGSYESSIVMAARPGTVSQDQIKSLDPVWIDLPARLRDGARTFTEAGAALGYFGDPAQATVAEGRRMLDALAEMVRRTVHEIDP